MGREGPRRGDTVTAALGLLAAARQATPTPAAPPGRSRRDKTHALALAWAREQVRLALGDILDRAAATGAARRDVARDTLAWLVLAAVEALAHEPGEAVPDRIRALREFLRPVG
ncbi:MAG: hypothetical protein HY614_04350 [Candidatus Rokubacteria bacterium]|nr:hypothetical protein [Candidatus Rokubacteria bacterium]